jgi:hypothetical protein
MEDLPSLCKLYEHALEMGYFQWDLYPQSLKKKGGKHLFSVLINQTFSARADTDLATLDPDLVQATRSFLLLFKKVEMESSDEAKRLAIEDFVVLDSQIPDPPTYWDGNGSYRLRLCDHYLPFNSDRRVYHTLRWMESITPYLVADLPRHWEMLESVRPKHGPGAVSDLPSRGDKYIFPCWPEHLCLVFPANGWAGHLRDCSDDSLPDHWGDNPHSKLVCVPKTLNKPRVIASEPTAMQYCQQALMVLLRKMVDSSMLSRVISFRDQMRSREILLCHDDVATIDLSSASDRLTCTLVQAVFQNAPLILEALRATRTQFCDTGDTHGIIKLKKFAPQGSAVTFPVQSICYSIAAIASVLYERYGKYDGSHPKGALKSTLKIEDHRIQVFGDDIIVPKYARATLEATLQTLGLKVNRAKSFSNDFKESCGMDVFKRTEVTPLYVRTLASSVPVKQLSSLVDVRNNAYHKGYWNLASAIEDQIPRTHFGFLPKSKDPLPGLRRATFLSHSPVFGKRRWDRNLQQWKVRLIVSRSERRVALRNSWTDLLQYFIEGSRDHSMRSGQSYAPGCDGSLSHLDPPLRRGGSVLSSRTSYDVRWVCVSTTS